MLRLKSKTAPKEDLFVVVVTGNSEVFDRAVKAAAPWTIDPHGTVRMRVMRERDWLKAQTVRYALEAE